MIVEVRKAEKQIIQILKDLETSTGLQVQSLSIIDVEVTNYRGTETEFHRTVDVTMRLPVNYKWGT